MTLEAEGLAQRLWVILRAQARQSVTEAFRPRGRSRPCSPAGGGAICGRAPTG
jgi:hypothetical protein